MRSLHLRLSAGLFISLLAGFIMLWLMVSNASRILAEEYIATRLLHDSETILAAINFDATGALDLDSTRLDPIYQRPFSGHYFTIATDKTRLRSRSLWDQDLTVTMVSTGEVIRKHIVGPQQQPLLLLIQGYQKSGTMLTLAVAEDLTAIETDLARIQKHFALVAIIVLLLLIVVQGFILHAGLRPLEHTRKELQDLAQGRLAHLSPQVPKEIAPLVREFNHLIDTLAQRLNRSRHALGDLAHALKNPLAVLTQLIQDKTLAHNPPLKQSLSQQLESIQQHTTRILHRARLAGAGPAGTIFIADQEIPALLATLRSMYHQKALQFDTRIAGDTRIAVDREDLLELIGNLMDNACKWARRVVRLSIRHDQATVIEVEDDGPGVADADLSGLARRGVRLDESAEGHGLGLAIVNDIVTSLGGTLQIGHSCDLGGLQVTVSLPGNIRSWQDPEKS